MSSISNMTFEQITARLQVIIAEQAHHAARDLDAELASVMRQGGDVDAIEAAHLDAERAVRRLRVERSALEAELPAVQRRDATTKIGALVDQHAALAVKADAAAGAIISAWSDLVASIQHWQNIQKEAESITRRAIGLAEDSGAEMPGGLGYFNSPQLVGVAQQWNTRAMELVAVITTAEQTIDTGMGDFSKRFARTALPTAINDNAASVAG